MSLRGVVTATSAASIVVTNTGDSAAPGSGSLRAALLYANANPGTTIRFNIPTSDAGFSGGVFTIQPTSALPPITANGTIIDGRTQTAFTGDTNPAGPEIVLKGTAAGAAVEGLQMTAASGTVRGLVINGFTGYGIIIRGAAATANHVEGCYVGTSADGTIAVSNGQGVALATRAHGNTIGGKTAATRNVLSGNLKSGVSIDSVSGAGTDNNVVQGNYIGTNRDATAALPNGTNGLRIADGAQYNLIGGTSAGARNVISGNTEDGVRILCLHASGTNNNTVQGNYIGTDATGTQSIPNLSHGVLIGEETTSGLDVGPTNNVIGGTTAGARNIISGNLKSGVSIDFGSGSTQFNIVQGNYVGTDVAGTGPLPNLFPGVRLGQGAKNNTIGGSNTVNPDGTVTRTAGNVISGNRDGGVRIRLGATQNLVQGNYIGLDARGGGAIAGSSSGHGIDIFEGAHDNIIGGIGPGEANSIAYNSEDGVQVSNAGVHAGESTTGNTIRGNAIYGNGGLGIDLVDPSDPANHVTPNDADDSDAGPNQLQNWPVITSVSAPDAANHVNVKGTFTGAPNTTFILDFYRSSRADASGSGEGETYVASQTVTTDASGLKAFIQSATVTAPRQFFTVTATNQSTGDTSEFSPVPIAILDFAPTGGTVGTTVTINGVNLSPVSQVKFNGLSAGPLVPDITQAAAGFQVVSDTQIKAKVPLHATKGHISVDLFGGAIDAAISSDPFDVVDHPKNDNFAQAQRIEGSSGTVQSTNVNATAETKEYPHASQAAQKSVWYVWTAPGAVRMTFDTQGSDFNRRLAVYTGASVDALTEVLYASASLTSKTFQAASGITYYIAVDGFNGAQGSVILNWRLNPNVRPPNDDYAGAEVLNGDSSSGAGVVGTNTGATRETFEPNHAGKRGGRSVWYRWRPSKGGYVTFKTTGSNFDTLLAVYSLSSLGLADLRPFAANDDAGHSTSSTVSFYIKAAQNFVIAVDGADGAEGNIRLSWTLNSVRFANVRWINPAGGNWDNPANWIADDDPPQHRVPRATDNVTVGDIPGFPGVDYTVTLDVDVAAASFTLGGTAGQGSTQTLKTAGHALALNGASDVTAQGELVLDAGTLITNGNLTVVGTFFWSGGVLRGKGTRYINPGGKLFLAGGAVKSLAQGSVINFGVATWSGAGNLRCSDGVSFDNYSIFKALNAALWDWDGVGDIPGFFNNSGGTFIKASVNATTFNRVAFTNAGTTNVQQGTLRQQGGGVASGQFTIASGAAIEFGSDYFLDGAVIDNKNGGRFDVQHQTTVGQSDSGRPTTFNNSGQMHLPTDAALNLDGGGFGSGAGGYTQSAGLTELNGGSLISQIKPVIIAGGTVAGNGTVEGEVECDGVLEPRLSAATTRSGSKIITYNPGGLLNISSNVKMKTNCTTNIDIGSASQYDRITSTIHGIPSGVVTLNGTLNVRLANGFRPTVGQAFDIIEAKTIAAGSHFTQTSGLNVDLGNGVKLVPSIVGKGTGKAYRLEAQPTLRIADVATPEGNSGSHNVLLKVWLSAASGYTVTVHYATANGTALAGSDYTATSGTLTFLPGQTSKTIPIQVLGDATVEPNETFKLTLSSPTHATLSDSQALVTITNDDSSE